MERKRAFYSEAAQGMLSLLLFWYILCGDPTRYPAKRWIEAVPGGPLASSAFFLACLVLLFVIEGARAAERSLEGKVSPVRQALACYAGYWKVAVPLTILGFAFFNEEKLARIWCPMFVNPSLLNISRAVLALTNNLHEGAWLVSCLAICAVSCGLYVRAGRKGGRAVLLPLAGLVAVGVLYFFVMPFHYHKAVFPVAAVEGAFGYILAFLARRLLAAKRPGGADWAKRLTGSRAAGVVSAPLRYVGRNWVSFWTASFFFAFYFYNIPASIHAATGSMVLSYLALLAITVFVVFALNWCCGEFLRAWKASKWAAVSVLAMLALPFILYAALQISAGYRVTNRAGQWTYYPLISCVGIMCVIMALRAVTGRWHVAGIVATALFTVLAIANHFTLQYHGTLLTIEDLRNIQTAANVAGGYDFSVDDVSRSVLLYGLAGLACCLLAWLAFRKARPAFVRGGRWVTRGVCLTAAAGMFFFIYLARMPMVDYAVHAFWDRVYANVGYFNGTVINIRTYSSPVVRKPAGFSEERVDELAEAARARVRRTQAEAAAPAESAAPAEPMPDIIMILNETWYNLDDFMETNADADYMKNYNAMDNAVKGHVVVPIMGGGTNSSEYESLTGNSTSLLNAYSPFSRMGMTNQVSLPSYLKQYGYTSFAAHPMYGKNYVRNQRWKQLGFDDMYFIEDFTDLEFYGNRKGSFNRCTDLSAFRNMVRFYSEMPEDKPRLGYFITIQNHGGWDSNTPQQALVHSSLSTEKQSVINKVDEFLSCISLTDESIAFLQQYYTELYQTTGRRVVVCMFGDHCTSMMKSMKSMSRYTDADERELWERSTPYFIWANYPLDMDALNLAGTDTMDLSCLMPTVLDVAGVPLSYYYQHITEMRKDVSAFTNVGASYTSAGSDTAFCDREGKVHTVDEETPAAQALTDYYSMEYNLIADEAGREQALFWPNGVAPGEASGG